MTDTTIQNLTAQQIIQRRKELWQQDHSIERDRNFIEAIAARIVDPEKGEQLRAEIKAEPRLIIEMVFVVVDKEMNTVPFFLNDVQRAFSDDLYQAEDDFRQGRILSLNFLILKGRQQGFTAYITAEQLARSILKRNFSGFTIADCSDNTTSIFQDKAKFTYEHIPDKLKPTEKYNNRRELLFDKINSKWRIATASKDVGRSKTVNFFHGSEAAFWPVLISDIQAAIGEAFTRDAIKIYETTANGYNEYKEVWDNGPYIRKFYEWWLTKEYRVNFESQEREAQFKEQVNSRPWQDKKNKGLDAKSLNWILQRCNWLRHFVGLDWQQVYWYYNKWDSYTNKEKLKQEYPCSADEAFLASGKCIFDKEKIIQWKAYLQKLYQSNPPKRGRFSFEWNNPDAKDFIKNESIKWIDDPNGPIMIYEDRQEGYPYVIGGDTKGEGRDFYAGTVINNVTGKRCAKLRMQLMTSKPYTHQMYCLGIYFNTALIGIEMNWNTAPIEELERLKYPLQYVRRKYDEITKKLENRFGWRTDGNTRPLIIDKEVELIADNIELISDIEFLDECLTFVEDENGRPDAESGCHDDVLLSDMIANEIRGQQRFDAKVEKIDNRTEIQKHKERLLKNTLNRKRRIM